MKLRLIRGEYDSLCCPLTVVEHHWADDNDLNVQRSTHACGQELHVVYTATINLSAIEDGRRFDPNVSGGWAHASSWQIECAAGHVLATSTYDGTGGSDHGDFVDVAALFDLPGADPEDEEPGTTEVLLAAETAAQMSVTEAAAFLLEHGQPTGTKAIDVVNIAEHRLTIYVTAWQRLQSDTVANADLLQRLEHAGDVLARERPLRGGANS